MSTFTRDTTLRRWKVGGSGGQAAPPPSNPQPTPERSGPPRDSTRPSVARPVAPPQTTRRDPAKMTKAQARRLAITLVRHEELLSASEVHRIGDTYDLAVVDPVNRRTTIVRSAEELVDLANGLQQPAYVRDNLSGTVLVRVSFYDHDYNALDDISNVDRFSVVIRYHPDNTVATLVEIEPSPEMHRDIDGMLTRADGLLGVACSAALAAGEYERSRVLIEALQRLRRYRGE